MVQTFQQLCRSKIDCNAKALEQTIQLAVEITREGREGHKIGTLFVVSDEEETLKRSHNLILDPLYGHPPEVKRISDSNTRETIKELAQLDGAFVVAGDGVVLSAARVSRSADLARKTTLPTCVFFRSAIPIEPRPASSSTRAFLLLQTLSK